MAASSVSAPPLLTIPTTFILLSLMLSPAFSHRHHSLLRISSISAAPATLPSAPVSSPATIAASPSVLPAAPSPDITPLLPSPKGGAASPADSSLPVIPSSPSPPNPDYIMGAPGPVSGLEPAGAVLPESASGSGAVNFPAVLFCCLGVGFLVQGALL